MSDLKTLSHIIPIKTQHRVIFRMSSTLVLKYWTEQEHLDSLVELLGWVTPHQACVGVTPDISTLLQYQFYQSVHFTDKDIFPKSDEYLVHWLGVAEKKVIH
eukprot:13617873-Ditylum_brightwellii.AAC.1